MGWNSWNHFAGRVTNADIRAATDALVSTGRRDAGYIYVNIDIARQGKRDAKDGMEEVIGSIPIRSTKQPIQYQSLISSDGFPQNLPRVRKGAEIFPSPAAASIP